MTTLLAAADGTGIRMLDGVGLVRVSPRTV
jgi:hypothetical protein